MVLLTLPVSLGILYLQLPAVQPGPIQVVQGVLSITHILKRTHKLRFVFSTSAKLGTDNLLIKYEGAYIGHAWCCTLYNLSVLA